VGSRRALAARHALVLARRRESALGAAGRGRGRLRREARAIARHRRGAAAQRAERLSRLAATLAAHDPERVLERGYAIVESDRPGEGAGEREVLTTARAAREHERLRVRFSDDDVRARVSEGD
jgi:exodeoxyribonuclease VII large subunit